MQRCQYPKFKMQEIFRELELLLCQLLKCSHRLASHLLCYLLLGSTLGECHPNLGFVWWTWDSCAFTCMKMLIFIFWAVCTKSAPFWIITPMHADCFAQKLDRCKVFAHSEYSKLDCGITRPWTGLLRRHSSFCLQLSCNSRALWQFSNF